MKSWQVQFKFKTLNKEMDKNVEKHGSSIGIFTGI